MKRAFVSQLFLFAILFFTTPIISNDIAYEIPVDMPQMIEPSNVQPVNWYNYKPRSDRFHYHVFARFISDTEVELEDGSRWKTSFDDSYTISSWRPNDYIKITPKTWFCDEYTFVMNNYTVGTSVSVNLVAAPIEGGRYSYIICGLDRNYGKVYVSNGSYWQVQPADMEKFEKWEINDMVIFGTSSNWFSYKTMLINVDLNQYIFVKEI